MTPEPEDLREAADKPTVIGKSDIFYAGMRTAAFWAAVFLCQKNEKDGTLKEKRIDKETEQLKQFLICHMARKKDKEYQKEDRNSVLRKNYSLTTARGRRVYESFTDEELLECLRTAARELNHAPAQKEIFWVLRAYIKQRFQRWPYALKAAGLAASAGRGGKTMAQIEAENKRLKELLEKVREKAIELGKIPHPQDLPEVCSEVRKFYSDWGNVIEAANLDPKFLNREAVYKIDSLEPEYRLMLESVKKHAYQLGRTPLHGEIDPKVKQALIARCGSWRNALYQIGLEPVMRVRPFYGFYIDHRKENNRENHSDSLYNCFYKVLNLTERDKNNLNVIRELYEKSGSIPTKKDVPADLRAELQDSCGSWTNVLYQIGIDPKDYHRALKGGKRNGK